MDYFEKNFIADTISCVLCIDKTNQTGVYFFSLGNVIYNSCSRVEISKPAFQMQNKKSKINSIT
jgi:hypothetical protein